MHVMPFYLHMLFLLVHFISLPFLIKEKRTILHKKFVFAFHKLSEFQSYKLEGLNVIS